MPPQFEYDTKTHSDLDQLLFKFQLQRKDEAHAEGAGLGILIADGSDGALVKKIKKAATEAGAAVKIVAPRVAGAKLGDGSRMSADGQLFVHDM